MIHNAKQYLGQKLCPIFWFLNYLKYHTLNIFVYLYCSNFGVLTSSCALASKTILFGRIHAYITKFGAVLNLPPSNWYGPTNWNNKNRSLHIASLRFISRKMNHLNERIISHLGGLGRDPSLCCSHSAQPALLSQYTSLHRVPTPEDTPSALHIRAIGILTGKGAIRRCSNK